MMDIIIVMKLLTKNTDYATRALLHLAKHPGDWVPSRRIAETEGIPLTFVRQILRVLVREGFVRSREGADGGLQLSKDPSQVLLLEVIRLFQGEVEITACLFHHEICPNRATCVLRRRIEDIRRAVEEQFGAITLASLLEEMGSCSSPATLRSPENPVSQRSEELKEA
jgi:Rrf2 family protein